MTPAEIQELARQIGSQGFYTQLPTLVAMLVLAFAGAFVGSYLRRKGENLATKEDIGKLTRQEETVRAEFAQKLESLAHQNRLLIEQGQWRHQLRLAALDKRLETHQEAYSLWHQLRLSLHTESKCTELVIKCQDWWRDHCLFLDAEARHAFLAAYHAAARHGDVVAHWRSLPDETEERILAKTAVEENRDVLDRAGPIIVQGVELPSLGADELLTIKVSASP